MEEEVLSEVVPRDFLRCPLCRDEYQDPKFLPCLHSFCKACIDDHIESTTTPDGRFVCPVCLTEIQPPSDAETRDDVASGGVVELPDNTFARRLSCPIICHDKRPDRFCQRCEASGVKTDASRHCINCDECMCAQCSMEHLAEKETASHGTQAIEDFVASTDTSPPTMSDFEPIPRCCQFYDALDIDTMYCVDCEMATCNECNAKDHSDHRCAELSAIAQNFETKIKDPLLQLKKDEKKLRKEISYLDNAKVYQAKKQQKLKAMARERSKMLWNLIQEYENILNMEIDKRHTQNMEVIKNQHNILARHVASIYAVTDLTDKLLTFGSLEEKVSMRKQIGRRVRELCEGDLPRGRVELNRFILSEPRVGVESICEMFGELITDKNRRLSRDERVKKKPLTGSNSIDLGALGRDSHSTKSKRSVSISSTDEHAAELADLLEYDEEDETDSDMLSTSNASDVLRVETRRLSSSNGLDDMKMSVGSGGSSGHTNNNYLGVPNFSQRGRQRSSSSCLNDSATSDTSFQSNMTQNDVPCFNLEQPVREMHFPDTIAKDCIKGVGVTPAEGDIVVATVTPLEGSKVYILEKRGIVRGQLDLDRNFNIHSVGADGKVYMVVARSENRYKVRVLTADNRTLVDAHIESFGINGMAAMKSGTLLITSSRYASANPSVGRAAKLGGNVTMYDRNGAILRVITNETLVSSIGVDLFDRPHSISTDQDDNFFVADPGRHSVIGFKSDGTFLLEYGTTDAEEELYQGPDTMCTDRYQNAVVLDKKDGRIDILDYEGKLLRCYFPSQHIRYISVTPDRMLALVDSVGDVRFYDYFT